MRRATRTGQGDLRRFEQQVVRYQHRLYGFAFYFLGNREEAEDVTQEVLLRYWTHRDAVDEDRLLGWLLRVTRNACVDALRRRKGYRSTLTAAPEVIERAPGFELAPDDLAEQNDFRRHLGEALDRIRDPYRSILILREIQDLKYEEICGALDLPLNTVKVYLHRARKMLREQMQEVMSHETV